MTATTAAMGPPASADLTLRAYARGMAVPGVKFVYLHCSDLAAMRRFYTELVGLDEIYHSDDDRTVAYDCDGLQFTITEHPEATAAAGWARQPGWGGGATTAPSWSVSLTGDTFRPAIDRLIAAGVPSFDPEPVWREYWSFPVRDPMGNTVEITWSPE